MIVKTKKIEIVALPKLDAWSYSRWSAYQECPRKAYYKFVLKLPEPQGPALARGQAIHKLAEDFLLKRIAHVPDELDKLKTQYAALRRREPQVEVEVAFNRQWQPVSWFGKDAWCRIKIDALVPPKKGRVSIVDHKTGGLDKKTGKLKEMVHTEYEPQLELYAVAAFIRHADANLTDTALYHIDAGVITPAEGPRVYERKDLQDLVQLWEGRVEKMMNDTMYSPRPGLYCRWCHFRKANSGPCDF